MNDILLGMYADMGATVYPTEKALVFALHYNSLPEAVMGFLEEHRPLSNFHQEPFIWPVFPVDPLFPASGRRLRKELSVVWPSSENAYQFSKISEKHYSPAEYQKLRMQFQTMEPNKAKRAFAPGHSLAMRPDWNADNGQKVKIPIMLDILRAKFSLCSIARECLLSTGTAYLEETNWWYDRFWGKDTEGNGLNHLGRLLMQVRSEITSGVQIDIHQNIKEA